MATSDAIEPALANDASHPDPVTTTQDESGPIEPTPHFAMPLPRLTAMRAFAALWVFAFHAHAETGWEPIPFSTRFGQAGVAFFFVLSGFVLTWSTRPGSSARTFYVRRFARVYPSHFVMAMVALILPVVIVSKTTGIAANLLLVQTWIPDADVAFSLNAVSWSLCCEAFFYLMLPLSLPFLRRLSNRNLILLVGGWWIAMSLLTLWGAHRGGQASLFVFVNPLVRSDEFFLGVAAALLVMRGFRFRINLPVAIVICALLLAAATPIVTWHPAIDVVLALPFAAIIVSGARADIRHANGILPRRALVYAGEISFAFYLVHQLILVNLEPYTGGLPAWLTVAIALLVAIAAAVGLHHLVERPCQRWIRQREDRFPRRRSKITGTAAG